MHMFTDTLNVYKTVSQVLCFQCNIYSDFSKCAPATSPNYKNTFKKPKTNTETNKNKIFSNKLIRANLPWKLTETKPN